MFNICQIQLMILENFFSIDSKRVISLDEIVFDANKIIENHFLNENIKINIIQSNLTKLNLYKMNWFK